MYYEYSMRDIWFIVMLYKSNVIYFVILDYDNVRKNKIN